MNYLASSIKTATGEMLISGELKSLPDLSFQDLNRNVHLKVFEIGRILKNYTKSSDALQSKEFTVRYI